MIFVFSGIGLGFKVMVVMVCDFVIGGLIVMVWEWILCFKVCYVYGIEISCFVFMMRYLLLVWCNVLVLIRVKFVSIVFIWGMCLIWFIKCLSFGLFL